jgi:glycosyltransferase involved in cell wall biosynthesis
MKFSIIIPAYNAERTILSALESIRMQSFTDYEVIIINDGSFDSTDYIIINYFRNNNIKYKYFKTQNRGVSSARNLGWNNADGDYICFLDSDDSWHPDKLSIINKILQNNNYFFIGHKYQVGDLQQDICSCQVRKVDTVRLLRGNIFQTSCVCIKKEIPLRFDESMSYCEDYDLFLNISKLYKVYMINYALTKLNRPQLTKGGLSQNKLKMRQGELKTYRKFCLKYKNFLPLLPFLLLWSLLRHLKLLLWFKIFKNKYKF